MAKNYAARHLWQPHPRQLAGLYTAAVTIPPVVSAWLVMAVFLPEAWLGLASFNAAHPSPHHDFHLLSDLTARQEPTLAYLTLLFVALVSLFAVRSNLSNYWRVGSVIRRLEMNVAPRPPEQLALVSNTAARHQLDVGLVMSNYPFSFVWGFRRSKLILSSGLLINLTAEELTGVLEHEAAHYVRRDNLIKLMLSMCGHASLAFPLARLILRWRAMEVEMICDEVAAARTAGPLEIAEALVKLRRHVGAPVSNISAMASASSFIPDDPPSFTRRVRRLIDFADAVPSPAAVVTLSAPQLTGALTTATMFILTLAILTMCAPLAVHRATEALILNTPALLFIVWQSGRMMRSSEALSFAVIFLVMGLASGIGFAWWCEGKFSARRGGADAPARYPDELECARKEAK